MGVEMRVEMGVEEMMMAVLVVVIEVGMAPESTCRTANRRTQHHKTERRLIGV
jgi:hypothetical protein